MKIIQNKQGSRRTVEVSGDLTVGHSLEFKKALAANLKKGGRLELVIARTEEVDLSFLQVLAAATKTADKGNMEFIVRQPIPAKVVEEARLSGFLSHRNCTANACVWCQMREQVEGA